MTAEVENVPAASATLAGRARQRLEAGLAGFPWPVHVEDWTGQRYRLGGDREHWTGDPLIIRLRSERAGEAIASWRTMEFLEGVLRGDAELDGNLYLLPHVRAHARFDLRLRDLPGIAMRHLPFQDIGRARKNVKEHYDIPQAALDAYLDQRYRAYSCAWFDDPSHLDRAELLRVGRGREDDFDSLEKAQWRKFQNAVDFVDPRPGERLLDIGCGYGGQLEVALESTQLGKVVGWTHSANQVEGSHAALAHIDSTRWEVREGDYRLDDDVYDHITSTGMVSHVGPRGLQPYVRNVRRRIRRGGAYVHHALMRVHLDKPFELQIGTAFHKRFVWPGYHWFTLGQHIRALERGGFEVQAEINLTRHYAKTGAAWYERMMQHADEVEALMGRERFQAWRLFLAGGSGDMAQGGIHVHRIYCRAV